MAVLAAVGWWLRRRNGSSAFTSAVVSVALLSACGGDNDSASSATFASPVYGYSITHPSTWDVVEASRALNESEPPATASGATDILGRDANVRVSEMELPGVIIAAQPVSKDVRAEDWTASTVDTVSVMKGCDAPSRRDDIEIDGTPATLLTYRNCPPDLGYLHLWAVIVHAGRGFHIVWFNTPGDEGADRARSNECCPQCRSSADDAAHICLIERGTQRRQGDPTDSVAESALGRRRI